MSSVYGVGNDIADRLPKDMLFGHAADLLVHRLRPKDFNSMRPTWCGFSFTRWPTTWPASFALWFCRRDRAVVVNLPAREGGEDRRGGLHSRPLSTVFQMAEVAVPRDLFGRILVMTDELRPRPVARC
jgi:hypothetical protein